MFVHGFDAEDTGVAARTVEIAVAEGSEETGDVLERFIEYRFGPSSTGVCVFLTKGDEFFGETLGFFGLVPSCGYGFMGEEGGNEVAEEGLSVRGLAAKMAVFQGSAGHGVRLRETSLELVLEMSIGIGCGIASESRP